MIDDPIAIAAFAIAAMAAPLLFATLGALCSEYAGALAVFMDGAITLAGFVFIAITAATGLPAVGFVAASLVVTGLLWAVAVFTERTGANPFLTGLGVNLFATGFTSWLSSAMFGTQGAVSLTGKAAEAALSFPRIAGFPIAVCSAVALALFVRYAKPGVALRIAGESPEFLAARGFSPSRVRIASWCVAALFASCAGSLLAAGLGAWVPSLSAGRGWTALAAVYLGFRDPIGAIGAVLLFSGADYLTTIAQGTGKIPGTVILGFPYALSLIVFAVIPRSRRATF